jgi:class 3 adenylate cyclase/HAMP domain-containing protein
MFTTFRNKLLFWFLVLISSNFIVLMLTSRYLHSRNRLSKSNELVEAAYLLALKDVATQQNFFGYEVKNETFFKTGNSRFLYQHKILSDSILKTIDLTLASNKAEALEVDAGLNELKARTISIDSVFNRLVVLIKARGYKDFSLEGDMRRHAHWLENNNGIPAASILNLRRHEKDYIIRNELIYVNRFNALIDELNRKMTSHDSIAFHLNAYQTSFNAIVALDQQIGIKANTGLKQNLDQKLESLEASFNELVLEARAKEQELLQRLNLYYLGLTAFLVLISIVVSYFLAKRITRPLLDLTNSISRFVDSNFTAEENNLTAVSRDEVGKLTRNFSVMKEEVISRLKFFKQKVEERTAELALANQRLVKLNEANSRFVPKEFLQFLSKESIEDVMLGDQVEHEMTVMFTDIRSFTKISESLTPQENFDFINGYLKEIVPVIRKHDGFIDKYIGDSVMALFPGTPDAALLAALEFEKAVEEFNRYLTEHRQEKIVIGSGIHTGRLILGTIGNDHRLETTVISDAVNIASRLEGLTRHYNTSITVSEETIRKLAHPEKFNFRYLETVRVRGKSKSIAVYEVLSPLQSQERQAYQHEFNLGLEYLKTRKFNEARNIFGELTLRYPDDGALHALLLSSEEYMKSDMPKEWDGIKEMTSK